MIKINTWRPRSRTSLTLVVALAMLLSTGSGMILSRPSASASPEVLAYATSLNANGLLMMTNQQRLTNHLSRVYTNPQLAQAAQAKANEMVAQNYWSHTAPSGKTPWDFIKSAGYSFSYAGENLAYGYPGSAEVVKGWMQSPGHRANILNTNYQEVGFGYANSPNYQSTGPQTVIVAIYARPTQPFTPPRVQPAVIKKVHNTIKRRVVNKPKVKPASASTPPKATTPAAKPQPAPAPTSAPVQPSTTQQPNTDTWYYYYLWWLMQWWNGSSS